MGKLQYDSFYKFIVSVGFLLIVAPVFLLHFWMSGIYDSAITQQDLEALAPSAIKTADYFHMCRGCGGRIVYMGML